MEKDRTWLRASGQEERVQESSEAENEIASETRSKLEINARSLWDATRVRLPYAIAALRRFWT